MLGKIRAALLLASMSCAAHADTLRFGAWGGLHADTFAETLLVPFSAQSGTEIELSIPSPGNFDDIDVIEFGLHDAIAECNEGELLYLPADILAEKSGESSDFLPNSLQPCAVGQLVWSTVAVYNSEMAQQSPGKPELIADFFNTRDYPGKRVIHKSPRVLSEWALAASGVPLDKLYTRLSSPEQTWPLIERQLRSIEGHIVWVDDDVQAFEVLAGDSAAFAMVASNSIIGEAMLDRGPGVILDSMVQDMSLLAIPTNAANPKQSLQLLRHLTSVDSMLAISSALGVGSVRYSVLQLVNKAYRDYMPRVDGNAANTIAGNSKWWREESEDLIVHFAGWVEKVDALQSLVLLGDNTFLEIADF